MDPVMEGKEGAELEGSYVCHHLHQINSRGVWFGDDPLSYSLPSLLLQLFLISTITRIVHFLLKPFGQPPIVSEILGGVILGPSVLGQNLVFLAKVFPGRARVVLDTVSLFGFMFFIFLIGVKIDPTMVLRTGKKNLAVGVLGFFVPLALSGFATILLNNFLSSDNEFSKVLPHIVAMQSMSSYPVITSFLDELKILNSEIGRLASSSSVICDICMWSFLCLKFAANVVMSESAKVIIGSLLSGILFLVLIVFTIRPAALWVIKNTPEGRPVKEIYITLTLVAVMGCALAGEAIGINAILASLIFGLVIPDGPPLGAALVERLDSFVSTLLMPLFFIVCGLQMDAFAIQNLENVGVLQLVVLVAFVGKIIGTMLPLIFCRMPFRDALSFGLIMNTKGIVELAFLNDFKMKEVMTSEIYAIMVISVLAITGIVAPLVKTLYDPSKRFVAYKRRTILHSRSGDELRILVCLHSPENVPGISSLLKLTRACKDNPISLVVLHLIRLMGRASSVLVAHMQRDKPSSNPTQSERIFNVFKKFEQNNNNPGEFTVQCYKGISPYITMHNDVCSLALEMRTILIILPFHKQWTFEERVETSYAYRHLNKNVLDKAPCSVGILIDRGNSKKSRYVITEPSIYRVAVLFLGGADDREALAYALRMSEQPNVRVIVTRFLTSSSVGIVGGTERSKFLDAEILNNFRRSSQYTEAYQEKIVLQGADLIAFPRSIISEYNLVMVGRRHQESPIMSQLAKWNHRGELGAIGEILVASEVKGEASVLVVQQQTRLWGLKDPEESTHLRRIKL